MASKSDRLVGRRRVSARLVAIGLAVVVVMAGCSLSSGTLGGREKCWPEEQSGARTWSRGPATM